MFQLISLARSLKAHAPGQAMIVVFKTIELTREFETIFAELIALIIAHQVPIAQIPLDWPLNRIV